MRYRVSQIAEIVGNVTYSISGLSDELRRREKQGSLAPINCRGVPRM